MTSHFTMNKKPLLYTHWTVFLWSVPFKKLTFFVDGCSQRLKRAIDWYMAKSMRQSLQVEKGILFPRIMVVDFLLSLYLHCDNNFMLRRPLQGDYRFIPILNPLPSRWTVPLILPSLWHSEQTHTCVPTYNTGSFLEKFIK